MEDRRTGCFIRGGEDQNAAAFTFDVNVKVKVPHNWPRCPKGVPGSLRPRIFLRFGTTRVIGRQPYARAAFTPGEIPGTHF